MRSILYADLPLPSLAHPARPALIALVQVESQAGTTSSRRSQYDKVCPLYTPSALVTSRYPQRCAHTDVVQEMLATAQSSTSCCRSPLARTRYSFRDHPSPD